LGFVKTSGQAGCPSCHPTNSVEALKDDVVQYLLIMKRLTKSL